MSGASADRRPPQVTWGAALTVVCGVLLVATVFDALAGLHSVDTREQLAKTLDSPEARELGLGVDQATTALHALLLVGGAAAAVAVVLGGYAYLRHTGARAGLAVAAVVALVGSFAADPLLGVLLALGAGLLWSAPARSWFRHEAPAVDESGGSGREERSSSDRPHPESPTSAPAAPPAPDVPTRPTAGSGAPPPTYGFGSAPTSSTVSYAVPVAAPSESAPERRGWRPPTPGSVKAAVALTWTCCGLALIGLIAAAAVLANDRGRVLELLRQQPGYDRFADHEDALVGALWFVDGAFAIWTVAAAVVAVFVLRGHEWARVLLLVSAGVSALVALAAFPASVFHFVGSAVVLALLLTRSASSWFRHRRAGAPVHPTSSDPPRHDPPVW